MKEEKQQYKGIMNSSLQEICLCLGIITTVLSFAANSTVSSFCSIAMYLFWGISILLEITQGKNRINTTTLYMVSVYLFFLALAYILYLFGVHKTNGLGMGKYLIICALFYFCGNNISINQNTMRKLVFSYMIAHIFFTMFAFLLMQHSSLANAKNMSGQVLGIGVVLAFFIVPKLADRLISKVFFILWGLFSLFVLWSLHSRTPFVAILLVSIVYFFEKKRKISSYVFFFLGVIALVLFLTKTKIGYDQLQAFLIGDNRYSEVGFNNTDAIFSGRFDMYAEALKDFADNPLFGLGGWAYIDSFPIHVLRVGGLVYAVLLLPFSYLMLFRCLLKKKYGFDPSDCSGDEFRVLVVARYLSLFFIIISLMEGYPPLGPGATSFFLWLVLGMKDAVVPKALEEPRLQN